jgi:transposase-like protein
MRLPAEATRRLDALLNQLTIFRRCHRPRSPIPDHLRRAVLGAVESGVTLSLVSRKLGISALQIRDWRRTLKPIATPRATQPPPRILEVLSPPPASTPTSSTGLRVKYEPGRLLLEISF